MGGKGSLKQIGGLGGTCETQHHLANPNTPNAKVSQVSLVPGPPSVSFHPVSYSEEDKESMPLSEAQTGSQHPLSNSTLPLKHT